MPLGIVGGIGLGIRVCLYRLSDRTVASGVVGVVVVVVVRLQNISAFGLQM